MAETANDIETVVFNYEHPQAPPGAVWIWWSENDKAYLCSIPCKWHSGGRVIGHGDTEIAALIMAKDAHIAVLECVAFDYDALLADDGRSE